MGLNNNHLPVSVIAGLYKTSLSESVQTTQNLNKTVNQKLQDFQFLGENKKGICILVKYENDVYLPDKELDFLVSILHACKLKLGDVAIINCHRTPLTFEHLTKKTSCNFLLVFGMTGDELDLKPFTSFIIEKANGCAFVFSPAIEKLNDNNTEAKLLKSKLWLCLKQLFTV